MLIEELIAERGAQFGKADLRAIEVELALMPLDEAHPIEAAIRETLWLVVSSPDYQGDLTVEDLEGSSPAS